MQVGLRKRTPHSGRETSRMMRAKYLSSELVFVCTLMGCRDNACNPTLQPSRKKGTHKKTIVNHCVKSICYPQQLVQSGRQPGGIQWGRTQSEHAAMPSGKATASESALMSYR